MRVYPLSILIPVYGLIVHTDDDLIEGRNRNILKLFVMSIYHEILGVPAPTNRVMHHNSRGYKDFLNT